MNSVNELIYGEKPRVIKLIDVNYSLWPVNKNTYIIVMIFVMIGHLENEGLLKINFAKNNLFNDYKNIS